MTWMRSRNSFTLKSPKSEAVIDWTGALPIYQVKRLLHAAADVVK